VPEIEGKMNEWEYARLHINWVDIGSSVCKLTLFQNGAGLKSGLTKRMSRGRCSIANSASLEEMVGNL
jgi:hypothetical protein